MQFIFRQVCIVACLKQKYKYIQIEDRHTLSLAVLIGVALFICVKLLGRKELKIVCAELLRESSLPERSDFSYLICVSISISIIFLMIPPIKFFKGF